MRILIPSISFIILFSTSCIGSNTSLDNQDIVNDSLSFYSGTRIDFLKNHCSDLMSDIIRIDSVEIELINLDCNSDFRNFLEFFKNSDSVLLPRNNIYLHRNIKYSLYKSCDNDKFCVLKDTFSIVKGEFDGSSKTYLEIFDRDSLLFRLGPYWGSSVLLEKNFFFQRRNVDPSEGAPFDSVHIYNYSGDLIQKYGKVEDIKVFENGNRYLIQKYTYSGTPKEFEFKDISDSILWSISIPYKQFAHLLKYSNNGKAFVFRQDKNVFILNQLGDTIWTKHFENGLNGTFIFNSTGEIFGFINNSRVEIYNGLTTKKIIDSEMFLDTTKSIGKYSSIAFLEGTNILSVYITKVRQIDENRGRVERMYLAFYNMKGELLDLFETDIILNSFSIKHCAESLIISSGNRKYQIDYDIERIFIDKN